MHQEALEEARRAITSSEDMDPDQALNVVPEAVSNAHTSKEEHVYLLDDLE